MKRASIIFNPVARGLSRHRHLLQRTIETLRRQGIEARLIATEAPGTAGAQARREVDSGVDLILAAGGDGTVNEVASGILYSGVPMAILPGGTANVLAREMRLPIHLDRVAQQLSEFQPHPVSVGRLSSEDTEPRAFLCMAGVGLDAEIVSRVNPALKVRAGKLAYYVSGFSNFFDPLREFDVTVDGETYQASFGLISRVRNYGGDLEIARSASLLRDDFEVVLFRGTERVRFLPYLLGVALRQVHRLQGVTIVHGRSIECSAPARDRIFSQVDGELVGHLPASVDILPGALTMLLPPAYVAREQSYVDVPVFA
ncbi:MAG TPA: diacylglycerol kinase family protein [Bryobacteraceae bacterium]|nr:diacylglycerol kinase family protein [Bryobacteraceae bacterium]